MRKPVTLAKTANPQPPEMSDEEWDLRIQSVYAEKERAQREIVRLGYYVEGLDLALKALKNGSGE